MKHVPVEPIQMIQARRRRLLPVRRRRIAELRPHGDAMNRRRSSLAASPLLIGAITTLIVVVAVFLSYNANNGLPFVPTYNIKVELAEATGLQPSNQVRIAGTRVGIVRSLSLRQANRRTGRVTVIANLKLERKSNRCRQTRRRSCSRSRRSA